MSVDGAVSEGQPHLGNPEIPVWAAALEFMTFELPHFPHGAPDDADRRANDETRAVILHRHEHECAPVLEHKPPSGLKLADPAAEVRSVAELLGHQSLKMTMRYAHLSPAFLSAEVGLLDPPAPRKSKSKRARKGQRSSKRDRGGAKVVKFPKEVGSSGWTRTSNPPVNSRMLCH